MDFGKETAEEMEARLAADPPEPDNFAKLEMKLIYLQRFVGINQLIGDPEMEMLKEFFVEFLADFSISEVDYAIKLAVADQLEVKLDHWQNFSAKFLHPIFIKYRLLRAATTAKYFEAADALLEKEVKAAAPERAKEEQFLINKRFCEAAFENYKAKINVIGLYKVFDILWDLNLIPYTKQRMKQFETMALSDLKAAARAGGSSRSAYDDAMFSLTAKIDLNEKDPAKRRAPEFKKALAGYNALVYKTKELAARNVFAYLVETETEITTYFETYNLETSADGKTTA